jgi:Tol biopolymer transport system component
VQAEPDSDKTLDAGLVLQKQGAVETPETLMKEDQERTHSKPDKRLRSWMAAIIARSPFSKNKEVELPAGLLKLLDSPYSSVRKDAIEELGGLLRSSDPRLAELARLKLEKMKEDDSRSVSLVAEKTLSEFDTSIEENKPKVEVEPAAPVEETYIKPEPIKKHVLDWMPKVEISGLKKALEKTGNKSVFILAIIFLAAVIGLGLYALASRPSLLFSGVYGGEVNIYSSNGKNVTQITQATVGTGNWSAADGSDRSIYFTSNRDGKAEIYRISRSGEVMRITHTPEKAESWSPVVEGQAIYFTTNRDGKAEIYKLSNGKIARITHTPGKAESWSPVVEGQAIYFTTNRDGKAEIYKLSNGKTERITHTPGKAESWSPAIQGQYLYFTSNRDGKAEIYRLNSSGETVRVTTTPGKTESWSPVIQGQDLYFTSNRSGRDQIYSLGTQPVAVTDFESWTGLLKNRLPGY